VPKNIPWETNAVCSQILTTHVSSQNVELFDVKLGLEGLQD